MEYIIFVVAIAALLVLLFVKELYDAHKEKKTFIHHLRNHHGELKVKDYRPEHFSSIARYYEKHPEEEQVDDITWNDLGMDDVFKKINQTSSSAGEEILYYMLRSPRSSEEKLQHLEEVVTYFTEHTDERVNLQLAFRNLGYTGRFCM